MDAVLLVGGERTAAALGKVLVPQFYARQAHAASAAAARRAAGGQPWGLVVVIAPLPDEAAATLAADLARTGGTPVLLCEDAPEQAQPNGVIALAKPVNRTLFEHTLRVLAAVQAREAHLLEENRKLAARLAEARIVGRAKCALVAYRHLTEAEAHRYIEKQAMDTRLPRREVAEEILAMFEGA